MGGLIKRLGGLGAGLLLATNVAYAESTPNQEKEHRSALPCLLFTVGLIGAFALTAHLDKENEQYTRKSNSSKSNRDKDPDGLEFMADTTTALNQRIGDPNYHARSGFESPASHYSGELEAPEPVHDIHPDVHLDLGPDPDFDGFD